MKFVWALFLSFLLVTLTTREVLGAAFVPDECAVANGACCNHQKASAPANCCVQCTSLPGAMTIQEYTQVIGPIIQTVTWRVSDDIGQIRTVEPLLRPPRIS